MKNKLRQINPHAAGIDVGAEKIFACAQDDGYQTFGCFTKDFENAIAYFKQHQVTTVVIEATGIYWVALKDMIEAAGIEVVLVKAGDAKQLPGREKTDGEDCQWLRTLHQHGLLRPCFIPESNIRELRTYMRMREDHIQMGAAHIQHMQKAFTLMNIRLHQVISQLQGASGRRIIEAILDGQRNPEDLAGLCDHQILKTKREEVIASLQGNYKEEYLFMLRQAYTAWKFYNTLIDDCDQKVNAWMAHHTENKIPPPQTKAKKIRHHAPKVEDFHKRLLQLTNGNDISQLPGFTDYTALQLISEIGLDMSPWKSDKHFASWLGLSPKKHCSGKMKRNKRGPINTKAGQLFKELSFSLLRSKKIALGHFGRRIRSQKGPAIAIKAMARKLAILFYNTMTKGLKYVEEGIKKYEEQVKQTEMIKLNKWATRLGFSLTASQS